MHLAGQHSVFHPDDSPEIVTAAATLGIPHPPGYPLPTLLGRLAVLGLPGNPAFRLNLLAGFWGCLGALLGLGLAWRLGMTGAGTAGGWAPWMGFLALTLGLATLPQLAFQGASAKGGFYTLNLVLTLVAIHAFLPGPGRAGFCLGLGWLVIGLGLAGHYMSFVLFLPAMLLWSWRARPTLRDQAKLACLALPGLALYLYLPIRAGLHPALNWGDPSNWARLKQVLLRAQYSGAESGQDLGNFVQLTRHFFGLWQAQWSLPLLALALWGGWKLWTGRREARPLIACLGLHLLVVLAYNHPPSGSAWVINAFFLPTFVLSLPLMLAALESLADLLPGPWAWSPSALLVLVALAAAPSRLAQSDFSRDFLLYDYGRDLLLLPQNGSALLAAGGNDAFPVWYLQTVEGRNKGMTLVDVPLISPWYLDQLRPRLPELDPAWVTRDQVSQALLAFPRRQLFYSSHNQGDRGVPLGLLAWVPVAGQPVSLNLVGLLAPWHACRLRWLSDERTPSDGNREELIAYYPDSAQALAEFAQRQHSVPLLAQAQWLGTRLHSASSIRR